MTLLEQFSTLTARLYGLLPQCYRDADAPTGPTAPANRLTWNQASMLADPTGWTGVSVALARAGTPTPPDGTPGPAGADGTRSLAVTQLGSGDMTIWTVAGHGTPNPGGPGAATSFPVLAGETLSAFCSFQPAAAAQPVQLQVVFYDANGDGPTGSLIVDSDTEQPGVWTTLAGTFQVPDGSVWASLQPNWTSVPLGETHYISAASVYPGPWDSAPADASEPLLRWLATLADQGGEVEALLDRFNFPAGRPTCDLTDPAAADVAWLPWLAQLVGVKVGPTISDIPGARDAVRFASGGWQAGTKDAVANAARSALTGTQYCVVADHYTGDMWKLEVRTRGPETPGGSPDPVLVAILAKNAKPAGVQLVHTTYAATWDTLEAAYPTWDQWEAQDWQLIEDTGASFATTLTIRLHGVAYKSTGAS